MTTPNYAIDIVTPQEHDTLLDIWESSVRATHHFLKEENILFFKRTIHEHKYFEMVELVCVRDASGQIMGFAGTNTDCLEMLFVHADSIGKGVGSSLIKYALDIKKIRKIDVNEQNQAALRFYQRHGFKITGRAEVDGTGKPFPILHLVLP